MDSLDLSNELLINANSISCRLISNSVCSHCVSDDLVDNNSVTEFNVSTPLNYWMVDDSLYDRMGY